MSVMLRRGLLFLFAAGCGASGGLPGGQVATLKDQPVALGVVGNDVYAALFIDGIVSVPSSGGAVTPITASAGQNVFFQNAFAVDSRSIYWSQSSGGDGSGVIARAPLTGGAPTILSSSVGFTSGIALDANRVYWVDQDQGAILSVPISGGTATTVASGLKTPGGLALSHQTLFFNDAAGDLMSVPASGGNPTVLSTGPGVPSNVEVADWSPPVVTDDIDVYFSVCPWDATSGTPGLFRMPIGGGAPQLLAKSCATGIAVDPLNVYWVSGKQIEAVPIRGGTTQTLTTSAQMISAGPALDESNVYWGITPQLGTCGLCPAPQPGQVNAVMRAPKFELPL
jgi:hypothetical protein